MSGGLLEGRCGGRCTSTQTMVAEEGGWVALSEFIRRVIGSKCEEGRCLVYTTISVAYRPPLPPSDPPIA